MNYNEIISFVFMTNNMRFSPGSNTFFAWLLISFPHFSCEKKCASIKIERGESNGKR